MAILTFSKGVTHPIYLHLIFAILQFEISSLMNWIFLPAVACKIPVWSNSIFQTDVDFYVLRWEMVKLSSLVKLSSWALADCLLYKTVIINKNWALYKCLLGTGQLWQWKIVFSKKWPLADCLLSTCLLIKWLGSTVLTSAGGGGQGPARFGEQCQVLG